MNTVKPNLRLRIFILFITVIMFMQFSLYYYVQIKVDKLQDNDNSTISQNNQLSEIMFEKNMLLLEQLKCHQDQLDVHSNSLSELSQNISGVEDALVDINKNISALNENYEELNYLYSKINTQTKTDNIQNNEDISNLYYGRLYIPDANISVALYYSWEQYITDRVDSASIFSWSFDYGHTIADHNNQEFSKLFNVRIGMRGYIERNDGSIINIECTEIFNGHNTGDYIVDENGVIATSRSNYTMYTCIDHWTNVRICLWKIV